MDDHQVGDTQTSGELPLRLHPRQQGWLAQETPGLVVVDLGMPGMGGLEAIGRVRGTARKRVPVVVFTGHDDRSEAEECRKAGATDVVQKPTDFNSFRSAVQRIVTHTRW